MSICEGICEGRRANCPKDLNWEVRPQWSDYEKAATHGPSFGVEHRQQAPRRSLNGRVVEQDLGFVHNHTETAVADDFFCQTHLFGLGELVRLERAFKVDKAFHRASKLSVGNRHCPLRKSGVLTTNVSKALSDFRELA